MRFRSPIVSDYGCSMMWCQSISNLLCAITYTSLLRVNGLRVCIYATLADLFTWISFATSRTLEITIIFKICTQIALSTKTGMYYKCLAQFWALIVNMAHAKDNWFSLLNFQKYKCLSKTLNLNNRRPYPFYIYCYFPLAIF